jgi:hypothetical protein
VLSKPATGSNQTTSIQDQEEGMHKWQVIQQQTQTLKSIELHSSLQQCCSSHDLIIRQQNQLKYITKKTNID